MNLNEAISFALFRSLYRRYTWDWVRSLFRHREPFEPCRIYHMWDVVHQCPEHVYFQCRDCMERTMGKNPSMQGGRHEFVNESWLAYEELEFKPQYSGFSIMFE